MLLSRSLRPSLPTSSHQATRLVHQWADSVRNGFLGTVGKTPLIELKSASKAAGCKILAKAEFLNAGGSVKDRAAWNLIADAEARGQLKPGGVVVEGTAGNTGIGLAHICNAKGYKCVIFMPNTQSPEKIDALRLLGADVRPVPAVAFTDANNYNHQAKRYADSTPNAVWTNQFDNTANLQAHYLTTGPEIWHQTEGAVTAFTCATGTGGTLAGTGKYLKEKNKNIKVILADPPGSVLFSHFTTGKLERTGTGSVTEGIGQGRITDNTKNAPVDDALHIPDALSTEWTYRLLHEDGFFVGLSSGLNVAAAVELGRRLGSSAVVTTVLCDSGLRYAKRICSKQWLRKNNLLSAVPEKYQASIAYE